VIAADLVWWQTQVVRWIFRHPLLTTTVGALVFFWGIWCGARSTLADVPYNFDPRKRRGEFEPHAKRYQELARLITTLSTASVAFLFNFLVNIHPNTVLRSEYSFRLEAAAPVAVCCFGVSVLCLITFLLLESYWYEEYSHSEAQDTYMPWKYSTNIAFGYSGLFWFVCGYALLAAGLFSTRSF
jgi:hypothetical protein